MSLMEIHSHLPKLKLWNLNFHNTVLKEPPASTSLYPAHCGISKVELTFLIHWKSADNLDSYKAICFLQREKKFCSHKWWLKKKKRNQILKTFQRTQHTLWLFYTKKLCSRSTLKPKTEYSSGTNTNSSLADWASSRSITIFQTSLAFSYKYQNASSHPALSSLQLCLQVRSLNMEAQDALCVSFAERHVNHQQHFTAIWLWSRGRRQRHTTGSMTELQLEDAKQYLRLFNWHNPWRTDSALLAGKNLRYKDIQDAVTY